MTTQAELQRARQIVEHNKTFILDAITKKYAELFKAIEDYDYIYFKGTASQEREQSIELHMRLTELNICEDDAIAMFDEYKAQVDDWKNACGESEDN